MFFYGLGFTVQKLPFCEFYGLRQKFSKFRNYLLGFTAKNNPKFSSLGFTVQISLILCKCAFGTIFGTFICTMHLPNLPFRKIKWLSSTHIGESVTNRFVPPKKNNQISLMFGKCASVLIFGAFILQNTPQIAPLKNAFSQN